MVCYVPYVQTPTDLGYELLRALDGRAPWPPRTVEDADAVHLLRHPNRRLTGVEVDELAAAYRAGAALTALATEYGVHTDTVRKWLRRRGVNLRPQLKQTPELTNEIVRLYKSGLSTAKIGPVVGVGQQTVWRALKGAGVKMRPPIAGRSTG